MQTVSLVLLPGLDGTGRLFEPLLGALPDWIAPLVVSYPTDRSLGYAQLLPVVTGQLPVDTDFFILGESFSGPLAVMGAAEKPNGLRGIIFCGSFVKKPFTVVPAWLSVFSVTPIYQLWPATIRLRAMLRGAEYRPLADMALDAIGSVDPGVIARRVKAILNVDVESTFAKLQLPMLYLAGNKDRLIRRHNVVAMQSVRPDLQVGEIDTRHFILQLEPEKSAAAIEGFIRTTLSNRD